MKKSRQIELLEMENATLKSQLATTRLSMARHIEMRLRNNEEIKRLREECISKKAIEEFAAELAKRRA